MKQKEVGVAAAGVMVVRTDGRPVSTFCCVCRVAVNLVFVWVLLCF